MATNLDIKSQKPQRMPTIRPQVPQMRQSIAAPPPRKPRESGSTRPKSPVVHDSTQGGIVLRASRSSRKSGWRNLSKHWLGWRGVSLVAFSLALLAIIGVVVHVTLVPDTDQVNNYATYAFFLLWAGTISLALETRRQR